MTPPLVPGPSSAASAGLRLDLCTALTADLHDWSVNLDAGTFTQAAVRMLRRDLGRAIPSALGYTLRVGASPGLPEVSITVADERLPPGRVRSSLTFDLRVTDGCAATATFYAGEPAACDQLAAQLTASGAVGADRVVLGDTLDRPVVPGVLGLADHTQVNYAIGVLLGRGYTFAEARGHLMTLAERHGSVEGAAAHLLATFGA